VSSRPRPCRRRRPEGYSRLYAQLMWRWRCRWPPGLDRAGRPHAGLIISHAAIVIVFMVDRLARGARGGALAGARRLGGHSRCRARTGDAARHNRAEQQAADRGAVASASTLRRWAPAHRVPSSWCASWPPPGGGDGGVSSGCGGRARPWRSPRGSPSVAHPVVFAPGGPWGEVPRSATAWPPRSALPRDRDRAARGRQPATSPPGAPLPEPRCRRCAAGRDPRLTRPARARYCRRRPELRRGAGPPGRAVRPAKSSVVAVLLGLCSRPGARRGRRRTGRSRQDDWRRRVAWVPQRAPACSRSTPTTCAWPPRRRRRAGRGALARRRRRLIAGLPDGSRRSWATASAPVAGETLRIALRGRWCGRRREDPGRLTPTSTGCAAPRRGRARLTRPHSAGGTHRVDMLAVAEVVALDAPRRRRPPRRNPTQRWWNR